MRVHLYTICWNERRMLPFFFRHYDDWVDRYVFYDDGSTDGTLDLLAAHPRVEVRRFRRVVPGSYVQSAQALHEEMWKESRGTADWVVITPVDEHLVHPAIGDYLARCQRSGITAIPALGFQMVSDSFPAETCRLAEACPLGAPDALMSKLSVFDPAAITATGFGYGRHTAAPEGRVVFPGSDTLVNLHYKYMTGDYLADRNALLAGELGEADLASGFGAQYNLSPEALDATWQDFAARAVDYRDPSLDPWQTHPQRWWRAPPRLASAGDAAMPDAPSGPAVNLVRVRPEGYRHWHVFAEAMLSLRHGLRLLGIEVRQSDNTLAADALNIVFGAQLLPDLAPLRRHAAQVVLYNTEQLVPQVLLRNLAYTAALGEFTVWDANLANVRTLVRQFGPGRTHFVPICYAPAMTRPVPSTAADIDVLFYGSMTPRRQRVWESFTASGLAVVHAFDVYDAARDAVLARSRLVLNIHAHDESILEVGRIVAALANRVPVVSERTPRTDVEPWLAESVAFAPADRLVETCRSLLADPARRAAQAEAAFDRATAVTAAAPLRRALAATLRAAR